jgi:hypothetical protein
MQNHDFKSHELIDQSHESIHGNSFCENLIFQAHPIDEISLES